MTWEQDDLATVRAVWAALIAGDGAAVAAATQAPSGREGMIVTPHCGDHAPLRYNLDLLVEEVTVSINTTAAGGNASLMALA